MYQRLITFINKHKLLYDYQFGFWENSSTAMALITIIDKITESLERGDYALGMFLDFSKAFDTVDHSILLKKLHNYGIRGIALDWFDNYLKNREQFVTYNSVTSNKLRITCGVPQGSILGPLLFLLYINDLSTVSDASLPFMFADDTTFLYTGNNLNTLTNNVNTELIKIDEWLKCNKLSINIKKTHYIIFSSKNKIIDDNQQVKINSEPIERVYYTKFLGVFLDSNLNWKKHIEYVSKKISKSIGILCKARKLLNKPTLVNLYYTFVYPYYIYGIQVWGGTYPTNLQKLVLLQKKAIRIITCSKYMASTQNLFTQYKLLRLPEIYKYLVGIFVYKFDNMQVPVIFSGFYAKARAVHSHDTRTADNYRLINIKLNVRKHSMKISGAAIWNMIPMGIRLSKSLEIFKNIYKYLYSWYRYGMKWLWIVFNIFWTLTICCFTEQQPHFLPLQLIFILLLTCWLIVIVMYFQREWICTIY